MTTEQEELRNGIKGLISAMDRIKRSLTDSKCPLLNQQLNELSILSDAVHVMAERLKEGWAHEDS